MSIDYYQTLEIHRQAFDFDVAKAYRKLALRWHPKLSKDDYNTTYHHFCLISEAYEVLSDPIKRTFYDKYGEEKLKEGFFTNGNLQGGYRFAGNPEHIFEQFFGSTNPFADLIDSNGKDAHGSLFSHAFGAQNFQGIEAPIDLKVVVDCTLNEIYNGCSKSITYSRTILNKDGRTTKDVIEQKVIQIRQGIQENQVIQFKELGNEVAGQKPSDLIFIIKQLHHPLFTRKGHNLIYIATISLSNAICADPVQIVPFINKFNKITLDNRKLQIPMDEIISTKTIKEIKGEGMPEFTEFTVKKSKTMEIQQNMAIFIYDSIYNFQLIQVNIRSHQQENCQEIPDQRYIQHFRMNNYQNILTSVRNQNEQQFVCSKKYLISNIKIEQRLEISFSASILAQTLRDHQCKIKSPQSYISISMYISIIQFNLQLDESQSLNQQQPYQDPANHEIITFTESGKAFIVLDELMLCSSLLTKCYKHNNYSSFIRQLNMYGFKKIRNPNSHNEFHHQFFQKHQKILLEKIKRRNGVMSNKIKAIQKTEVLNDKAKNLVHNYFELKQEFQTTQEDIKGMCNIVESVIFWAKFKFKFKQQSTILNNQVIIHELQSISSKAQQEDQVLLNLINKFILMKSQSCNQEIIMGQGIQQNFNLSEHNQFQ